MSRLRDVIEANLREEQVSCYLWAADTCRAEPNFAILEQLALDESVKHVTDAVVAAVGPLLSLAGDLWNELENLREYWQDTERAPLIEAYLAACEQEAGVAS